MVQHKYCRELLFEMCAFIRLWYSINTVLGKLACDGCAFIREIMVQHKNTALGELRFDECIY